MKEKKKSKSKTGEFCFFFFHLFSNNTNIKWQTTLLTTRRNNIEERRKKTKRKCLFLVNPSSTQRMGDAPGKSQASTTIQADTVSTSNLVMNCKWANTTFLQSVPLTQCCLLLPQLFLSLRLCSLPIPEMYSGGLCVVGVTFNRMDDEIDKRRKKRRGKHLKTDESKRASALQTCAQLVDCAKSLPLHIISCASRGVRSQSLPRWRKIKNQVYKLPKLHHGRSRSAMACVDHGQEIGRGLTTHCWTNHIRQHSFTSAANC